MPFQTETDLLWQEAVKEKIKDQWGYELHFFGPMDEVDGWIEGKGQIVAIVEIKRRHVDRNTYPTIWVSLRKWTALMLAHQGFGKHGLFIVHYNDGIYYYPAYKMSGYPLVIGGREDRGTANDREPVIDLPVRVLVKL
jgi:hypothetical protein